MTIASDEYGLAAVEAALEGPIELIIGLWPNQPGSASFDLFRAELHHNVAADFRRAGKAHLRVLKKNAIINFDAGYTPDSGETMRLPIADFDDEDLLNRILSPALLPAFDFENSEGVAFHCFVVNHHGSKAAFLRRAASVVVTRRNVIAGIFFQGRIDRIEQPVLSFSPAVDIMIDQVQLWITNSATYRSLFRMMDTMKKSVDENVGTVISAVPVANVDEFVTACKNDARMMAKLARVAAKPYLQHLTTAMIKDIIDNYGLPSDVLDEDGRLVHANSPQRRWLILRILDDSYLESVMTTEHYEVNSKRQL